MSNYYNRQWRLPNNENKDKQSNYSMDFDGSSQYIEIAHNSYFDQSVYSFSFWINNNLNSGVSNDGIITADSSSRGWSILQDNQTFKFNPNISGGSGQINVTNFFNTTNTWIHCAITFDGTNLIIYKNGTSVGSSSSGTRNLNSNNNPLIIGNNTFASGRFFNGQIDAVSIFDYALSPSQITTLYGSSSTGIGNPMSISPKPVAYYPLGDQDAFNGSNYLVPNSSLKDYVFSFNGLAEITTGGISGISSNTTVSFWFNNSTAASGNYVPLIASLNYTSTTYENFAFRLQNGLQTNKKIQIVLAKSGNYEILETSAIIDNAWYFVALTTSTSGSSVTATLYLNGTQVATNSGTDFSNLNDLQNGLTIGHWTATGNQNNFNGTISNVQIFNTALSATGSNSIETLYNNGSPLTSMSGYSSLQGWWKLDASATYDGSNWTIEDSSSNSNDGTSSGMTQANLVQSDLSFKTSYSPFALNFDGTNDRIDTGAKILNNMTSYTASIWAKGWSTSALTTIMSQYDGGSVAPLILTARHSSNTNGFTAWLTLGGTFYTSHNDIGFSDNTKWINLIVTWNGSNLILYINGIAGDVTSASGTIDNSTTYNFHIGGYSNVTSNSYNGQLSNCSVWNTALTSTQVTEIYAEGIPQNLLNHSAASSLVSWWQLGSNSSFNSSLNQWTCIDEKGTNTGVSSQTFGEDAIVDGVGSYANGVGTSGLEVVGNAPYSTANALSVNMDVLDRTDDTPS